MFSLTKPTEATIRAFAEAQAALPFSYDSVGATATVPPAGFTVDRTLVRLGKGEAAFAAAKAALGQWRQFRLGWIEPHPLTEAIQPGTTLALLARSPGMWALNASRVVYVTDEPTRYAYACGTLPDHIARGEERFLVERDPATDEVWYDVLAFSRPANLLARIGYPYMRWTQKRFGREAAAAIRAAAEKG
jgi:uncharacterized protein (UPF0548 family)